MSRGARFLVPLSGILLAIGALAALLVLNPTAREVTIDALGLAFAFFTTPFVLETTCAALFLLALLAYNRWRLHKEGDGWVWLITQEPEAKNLPATITQRLQSTVLEQKPEPVDELQAESGIIEGYLELGMPAQALRELDGAPAPRPPVDAAALRIRVLAANLDTERATQLLRETASVETGARRDIAAAALESARWLLKHVQREDLARHWIAEAGRLDPTACESVTPADPLRKLM